jgi:hypothetical protein
MSKGSVSTFFQTCALRTMAVYLLFLFTATATATTTTLYLYMKKVHFILTAVLNVEVLECSIFLMP